MQRAFKQVAYIEGSCPGNAVNRAGKGAADQVGNAEGIQNADDS